MEAGSRAAALIVGALLLATGCASARNYADPAGPVFAGGAPSPPALTRSSLRIVTFNLAFGVQVDRAVALFRAPGALHDADLVVLQEMDERGVERFADALGAAYVYVPSAVHPTSGRDFGVGILSRWPILEPRKLVLPHRHRLRGLQRAAVAATVATPLGPVRVYGVHLETPLGATNGARADQARLVLADAATWSGPVIVAGDFNGAGGDRAVEDAGFIWLTRRIGGTAGPLSIDHIFVRDLCAGAGRAAGRGVVPRGISDHRPVWAVVQRCATSPRAAPDARRPIADYNQRRVPARVGRDRHLQSQ